MSAPLTPATPTTPQARGAAALSGRRWLLIFLVLGIGLRVVRWALAMPVWGDEAMIGLNIIHRDYRGLLRPLDHFQVAPILWLWTQRAAYDGLGMSEWAVRLPALLAGIAALLLFWRWARLLVAPPAATIAVGIAAVAYYVVRHGVELKPYAFDLLAALALLLPATHYLLGGRRRWLVGLILLTPLCLLGSYPAVFTAGGIFVALLPALPRARRSGWVLVGIYGLVLGTSFLAEQRLYGAGQYQQTATPMTTYWADAFPPLRPGALLVWLAQIHTGNLFAYPWGGKNGASTASLILFLLGLWAFRRQYPGRAAGPLGALLLVPFALTFLAAAMHRYPYGGSARVSQHLAPAIILMMGVGAAALLERLPRSASARRRATQGMCALLLAGGLGYMAQQVLDPYKTPADRDVRESCRNLVTLAGPAGGGRVVVLQPRATLWPNYQWYLAPYGPAVLYDGWSDPSWRQWPGRLYLLNTVEDPALAAKLRGLLGREAEMIQIGRFPIGPKQVAPAHWEVLVVAPR